MAYYNNEDKVETRATTSDTLKISKSSLKFGPLKISRGAVLPSDADSRVGDIFILDDTAISSETLRSNTEPSLVALYQKSASSTWSVATGAGAAITALNDIPDVTAPTPANGDALTWNGTAWVPMAVNGTKQSVAATIAARDALVAPAAGDLAYVTDASADATVAAGAALYVHDGGAWVKIAEFESMDWALADATLAADDAIGSGGTALTVARSDHKHIAQGVSADAKNILTVGTDGLHQLPLDASAFARNLTTTDTTLQNVADAFDAYNGNVRVFADDTTVAPATAGAPTVAEITTFAAGTIPATVDTLVYYNGTNIAATAPTYVYWVDSAGTATVLLAPAAVVRYTSAINATTDWGTASGGLYSYTVTAATHGLASVSNVTVLEGTDLVQPDTVTIAVNSDVTISVSEVPDTRFAGTIIIT